MSLARTAKLGLLLILLALALELGLQLASRLVPERGGQWREGARYRVLALGDSHTWGSGVGRSDAYPGQLQDKLELREPGVYSVLNLGLPGMSTTQLRNRFAVTLSRYRPDAIVIWCGANNLWNHAERDHETTPARLRLDGWLTRLRSYRLVRVWLHDRKLSKIAREAGSTEAWEVEHRDDSPRGEQRFRVRHDGVQETITHEQGANDEAALYDRTLQDLDAIAAAARAAGVALVLVTYPIDGGFFVAANRAIRDAAARNGLPLVESSSALARIPAPQRAWAWALHPDARLYGEVADDLVPVVEAARDRVQARR